MDPPAYLKTGRETDTDRAGSWNSASLSTLRDDLEGFWKR